MDDFMPASSTAQDADQLRTLTARVDQLEQAIAELRQAASGQAFGRSPLHAGVAPHQATRGPLEASPDFAPPPPPIAQVQPVSAAVPRPPAKSLEDRVGSQVFNLIGIVALIAGSAWALKLAIEHGFIGPLARVLIGIAAGVGLVLWSEFFRRKDVKAFSYSLKAVGSAVLYLTLWAGFQLYHLMPATLALGLMILVTAWNAFMAYTQDSEPLAWYALLGGFATPLLLSTGGNHETFLFTYIAAIDLATVLLLRLKPWRLLLLPSFLATVAFFTGWYTEWFHRQTTPSVGEFGWNTQSTETVLFAGLFWIIFVLVSLKGWTRLVMPPSAEAAAELTAAQLARSRRTHAGFAVLLPLANSAFLALALYSVLEDSAEHALLPWLMVALAAVYLLLLRLQENALGRAMHLAIAVTFLTVAIPLKASGLTLTTAWLVEGLVLFWAATRFEQEERTASTMLLVLSACGYLLGLGSLVEHWFVAMEFERLPFLNHNLGAALVALASLGGTVFLALRERDSRRGFNEFVAAALLAMDGVALLLILRELSSAISGDQLHAPFRNPAFLTSLVGLLVLAAVAGLSLQVMRRDPVRFRLSGLLSLATVVAFNLFTILCMEREIGALWPRDTSNLQRSLAISGFLMLYGSVLLAVGFMKRSAFTRWQALVLLLFTICKVFLYDTGSLSAGYRVASFMGLGAVLMAISYAYQKDWLGLKTAPALDSPMAVPPPPREREA